MSLFGSRVSSRRTQAVAAAVAAAEADPAEALNLLQQELAKGTDNIAAALVARELLYNHPRMLPDAEVWYPHELLQLAIEAPEEARVPAEKFLASRSESLCVAALSCLYMSVMKRFEAALALYRRYGAQSAPWALRALGLCYQQPQSGIACDHTEAARLFTSAAQHGDVRAMVNAARCHELGLGVTQDASAAVRWLMHAHGLEFSPAACRLAMMYEAGRGVPINVEEAVRLYRQAARKGMAAAQLNLARLFHSGLALPRAPDAAINLYAQAARQAMPEAVYSLALCYEHGKYVPQDLDKALALYQQASQLGCPEAANNLGLMHERGLGCQRNVRAALSLFEKAMMGGCHEGGLNAALLMLDERSLVDLGVADTPQKQLDAVKYLRHAAKQGNVQAMFTLALCLEEGFPRGLASDIWEALSWYQQAAEKGHAEAQTRVGYSLVLGEGLPENLERAFALFSAAGHQSGYAAAQNNLGYCHYHGLGCAKNQKEAARLFLLAAQANLMAATHNLAVCLTRGHGLAKDPTEAAALQALLTPHLASHPHRGLLV